ncbi:hypothetical protein ACFYP4_02915 [Streptomyces sp. NPDC005551]|uniref:hypothetical protein n=1 Tax=Streptomyces sp. NPDC005551 TaxID=3364725 RepID=UPI0036ACD472
MAAVDLGALKNGGGAQTDQREVIEVETAFMVIIRSGGIVQASPDINAPIAPDREPTIDDMQMAARRIYDDIQVTKTAQVVQMGMQQAAHQMAQQADAQRLAQSLKI